RPHRALLLRRPRSFRVDHRKRPWDLRCRWLDHKQNDQNSRIQVFSACLPKRFKSEVYSDCDDSLEVSRCDRRMQANVRRRNMSPPSNTGGAQPGCASTILQQKCSESLPEPWVPTPPNVLGKYRTVREPESCYYLNPAGRTPMR